MFGPSQTDSSTPGEGSALLAASRTTTPSINSHSAATLDADSQPTAGHWVSEYVRHVRNSAVRLAALGFLSAIYDALIYVGSRGDYVAGSLIVLLLQLSLPLTLILSLFLLRTSFHLTHYVGAVVTVFGVCVSLIPEVVHSKHQHAYAELICILCICVANFPSSLQVLLIEVLLKRKKYIAPNATL